MNRAMERGAILLGLILTGGCQETRYLSCIPRPPAVEAKSYDLHDPYPDETIGPKTGTRPRDFEIPRSDTRKTYDLRNLQSARATAPLLQANGNPTVPNANASVLPIQQPPGSAASVAADANMWDDSIPRYNVVPQ